MKKLYENEQKQQTDLSEKYKLDNNFKKRNEIKNQKKKIQKMI